jgi:hypothetical protein
MCKLGFNIGLNKHQILSITDNLSKQAFLRVGTEQQYEAYSDKLNGKSLSFTANRLGINEDRVRLDIINARNKVNGFKVIRHVKSMLESANT